MRIKIDESGLNRLRYGKGSQQHNLSLLSWRVINGIAPAGVGQYGSAVVDMAVFVLDAILSPTIPRTRAALLMIGAACPDSETRLGVASNLRMLAEAVELSSMETEMAPNAVTTEEATNEA